MPYADTDTDFGRPTRTFIYGPDKTKKTLWAASAANAGYNVILIDGDDGSSITRLLPNEARKKILVVDAVNTPGKAVFARFMATFMRGKPFVWSESEKVSITPNTTRDPNKSYIYFDVTKFTMNDVVILDSWTALAASTMLEWAADQGVDLTSVEKEGDQFSLLGFQSRFLDFVLNGLKTFPSHVIAIGHETVYEKFEGKGAARKVVEQRTQPFSSTGPHAKKIGSHFSNVMRFRKFSDIAFKIDTGGDKDTMGGCRQIAPAVYKWEEITPDTIFKAVGSKSTGEPCAGAIYIPPGGTLELAKSNTTNTQSAEISKSIAGQQGAPSATTSPVVDGSKKVSVLDRIKKPQT